MIIKIRFTEREYIRPRVPDRWFTCTQCILYPKTTERGGWGTYGGCPLLKKSSDNSYLKILYFLFSGLAPSTLIIIEEKFKGRTCEYRGIVCDRLSFKISVVYVPIFVMHWSMTMYLQREYINIYILSVYTAYDNI